MLLDFLISGTAIAKSDAAPTLPATPGVGGGDIVSLGVSMIIIVGAIIVLGWFYSRSRFVGGGANDVINIVATRALGPKERLMVVEVAEQQLLVGMTASGVQTLHVFDSPVVVASKDSESVGFAGRLRTAFQEIGK